MKIRILRRRGLGNGSTLGIKEFSNNEIEIIRNDKEIPEDTDLLIRWGCTSRFPSKKTLNKVAAIQAVNNKHTSRKLMQDAGVSVPKLFRMDEELDFPVIIRSEYHSQGKNLILANNIEEARDGVAKINNLGKNVYISKYINKDSEFGVFMFDNRVTSVIEKVAKREGANDELAWNVAQGSHSFQNVRWGEWNMEVIKEALDAWKCFDLTFGRIDIMVKDGKPYILEINSAHSLTSNYRKEVFAKCLDYYIENGPVKNEININEIESFKSVIHPALRKNKLGKNE